MKKGCFISVILILTIIVAGIFYYVKYYGDELLEVGKEKLVELAEYKIQEDIENLEYNMYVDSLKIVVGDYFNNVKELDIETELKRIEEFSDDFEVILMDSKIDSAEFDFITKILTKYGQRKENWN